MERSDLDTSYRRRSQAYLQKSRMTDLEKFRALWEKKRTDGVLHTQMNRVLVQLRGKIREECERLGPDAVEYVVHIPFEEGIIPVPSVDIRLVKEGDEWKLDSWGD